MCQKVPCCCATTVKSQHIGGARLGRLATCKGRACKGAPSPHAGKGRGDTEQFEFVSLKQFVKGGKKK